jgi:single-stranded-DNA-specific exonuclease
MTAFNEKQHIEIREAPEAAQQALIASGVQPIIARVFAARGIQTHSELDASLSNLIPFQSLKNCKEAAYLLADAIINNEKIVIVADYDADGATAAAIGILFFREMGVLIDYFVPNRFEHGYGLTPEIVDIVAKNKVNVIITVDNGIASVSGVSRANELGIKVLVTDHHLAGPQLPDADCIVNPNQPNDSFKSKAIAGVGVMFYVLIALRSELRERHYFNSDRTEPNLANLLDLVALGTVADVVPLDRNNRILVAQGLRRIRSGAMNHGIRALLKIAKKIP